MNLVRRSGSLFPGTARLYFVSRWRLNAQSNTSFIIFICKSLIDFWEPRKYIYISWQEKFYIKIVCDRTSRMRIGSNFHYIHCQSPLALSPYYQVAKWEKLTFSWCRRVKTIVVCLSMGNFIGSCRIFRFSTAERPAARFVTRGAFPRGRS